jgi:phospholipase C
LTDARRWQSAAITVAVLMIIGPVMEGCSTAAPARRAMQSSIKHVVILVKENHSFDNYFGSIENPPLSLPHCDSRVEQVGCQYDSSDIPSYYQYTRTFGYADNYFTDVRGPSWPNQMMMIAGQAPLVDDPPLPLTTWVCPMTCYDFPTIGDRLSDSGVTWRNYGEQIYDPFRSILRFETDQVHNVGVPQFFDDLVAGTLPAVAWVRPPPTESEHPGYDVGQGEQWSVNVVNSIMRSWYWSSTATLITWDDAGDVADHVVPPVLERSDTGKPIRYGHRVPLLVISPFTPASTVSHQLLSHVSLLKFIEDLFHIEPLTFRDRTANGLSSFFDFSLPARSPLILGSG